jgi:hypothetical protein
MAAYSYFTDWSGQIEVVVMSLPSPGTNGVNMLTATLPSEYVLVGGGANTSFAEPDKGAFITASYPDWNNNSWKAESKHHVHVDPHQLTVYAVGIKIQGVTPQTLRSVMTCTPASISNNVTQPYAQAFLSSTYKLIGGGARIDYGADDGNLLIFSRPGYNVEYWEAKGKDHVHQSFATIYVWAIGIEEYVPGFGYIDLLNDNSDSVVQPTAYGSTGLLTQVPNPGNYLQGWVPTCAGAISNYSGSNNGRMLCGFWPYGPNANSGASSKDINIVTSGSVSSYAIRIRKRP